MIEHMISRHALGETGATLMAVEQALAAAKLPHKGPPIMIAIQFYSGDQEEGLRLAVLLADMEPEFRNDVALVFARRFDVPGPGENPDLMDAAIYCAQKFPVMHIRSKREQVGHPDGCYGLWAGTCEELAKIVNQEGCLYRAVFFVEPDGVPLRWDWIDALKAAHAETLTLGKRITGCRVDAGPCNALHPNGSLLMELSCFEDHPSLHTCPPGKAWDQWHAHVLLSEMGPSHVIANIYGAEDVSLSVFKTKGLRHCWLSSIKDDSAWKCAETLLRPGPGSEPESVTSTIHHARDCGCSGCERESAPPADLGVSVDIVCKTYPPDYCWLPYLFRSVGMRVTGYRDFLLVLEEDYPVPEMIDGVGLPARTRIVRIPHYEPGEQSGKGAVISRLGIWRQSDGDCFVFVDSDCVFTRNVDLRSDPTVNAAKPVVLWRTWEESGRGVIWRPKAAALLGYNPERETMCRYPFQFPRAVLQKFWEAVGGEERMWGIDLTDWNALGNFAIDKTPDAITPGAWSNAGAACVRQFWSRANVMSPEVQAEMRALGVAKP